MIVLPTASPLSSSGCLEGFKRMLRPGIVVLTWIKFAITKIVSSIFVNIAVSAVLFYYHRRMGIYLTVVGYLGAKLMRYARKEVGLLWKAKIPLKVQIPVFAAGVAIIILQGPDIFTIISIYHFLKLGAVIHDYLEKRSPADEGEKKSPLPIAKRRWTLPSNVSKYQPILPPL